MVCTNCNTEFETKIPHRHLCSNPCIDAFHQECNDMWDEYEDAA